MKDDRYNVLNAIARGVSQGPLPPGALRDHPGAGPLPDRPSDAESMAASFERELTALKGFVCRVDDAASAANQVLELIRARGASRVLAWDDEWLAPRGIGSFLRDAGITLEPCWLPADREARTARLEAIDDIVVGLTGAYGALADTGSLALVSGPGRGRIASLLPPVHIAVVGLSQLYPSLPHFMAANPGVADVGANLVLVTGPSRTGDIELTLTLGVHGPGEVHVVLYRD